MSYTREPWEWSEHKFNAPPFEGTLEHECGIYPPLGESGPVAIASGKEDARRIVACVNSCAGIPTEELERKGLPLYMHEALTEQCAELLAALEGVLPFLTGNYWPGVEADAAVDRAIAIARKVGAGQRHPRGTTHR